MAMTEITVAWFIVFFLVVCSGFTWFVYADKWNRSATLPEFVNAVLEPIRSNIDMHCSCAMSCYGKCRFKYVAPSPDRSFPPRKRLVFLGVFGVCWIAVSVFWGYVHAVGVIPSEMYQIVVVVLTWIIQALYLVPILLVVESIFRYIRSFHRICCAAALDTDGLLPEFQGGCCEECRSSLNSQLFDTLGGSNDGWGDCPASAPVTMKYPVPGILHLRRNSIRISDVAQLLPSPTFGGPGASPPPRFCFAAGSNPPPGILVNPEHGSVRFLGLGDEDGGAVFEGIVGRGGLVNQITTLGGARRQGRGRIEEQGGMANSSRVAGPRGYKELTDDDAGHSISINVENHTPQGASETMYDLSIVAVNPSGKAIFPLQIRFFEENFAPSGLNYPKAVSKAPGRAFGGACVDCQAPSEYACAHCAGREAACTICAGREIVDWSGYRLALSRSETSMRLCKDCFLESKYYGARKTAHLREIFPKGPVFYQSRVRSFEREGTVIAPLQTGEDMVWVEFDHAQAQDASVVTVRDLEIIGWGRLQCAVEMLPLKPDPGFNFGCPVASFAAKPSAKLPSGLPPGLSLDSATGVISGTPTSAFDGVVTIVASNEVGQCFRELQLKIWGKDVPHSFSYPTARVDGKYTGLQFWLREEVAIIPNGPRCDQFSGDLFFSVSPKLPEGLELNARTGAISGFPTRSCTLQTFLVWASYPGGAASAELSIKVASMTLAEAGRAYFAPIVSGEMSMLRPVIDMAPSLPYQLPEEKRRRRKDSKRRKGSPDLAYENEDSSHMLVANHGEQNVFLRPVQQRPEPSHIIREPRSYLITAPYCAKFVEQLPRGMYFNADGALCGTPLEHAELKTYEIVAENEFGKSSVKVMFAVMVNGLPETPHDSAPVSRKAAEGTIPQIPGYKLLERLGEGAQGAVWLGMQDNARDLVAIKLSKRAADPRADREARVLHLVGRHPNVVQFRAVVDVDGESGGAALVMEWVQGETLKTFVAAREEGPFAIDDAAWIIRGVLGGLSALHTHTPSIAHRDVKPENIMLRDAVQHTLQSDRVVLVDFGLCQRDSAQATEITQDGCFLGTPAYFSPEQMEAKKDLDARVDVWAVGIILYELLRAKHPFRDPGDTDFTLIEKVKTQKLRKVPPPEGSVALNWFLTTALAKSRDKRFSDARLMLDAFDRVLAAPGEVPSDCEPVPPAKAGGEGAEFVIAVFASRIGSSADVHGEADKLRELFRNMEHVSFELLSKPSADSFFAMVTQLLSKPVRMVHFAGHGSDESEGFVWEAGGAAMDPEIVSRGTFSSAVTRLTSLECVVFNACNSFQVGLELHAAGVPYVLCFEGPVPDSEGIEFCERFYYCLSNRGNERQYGRAYEHTCDWASHKELCLTPCLLWRDNSELDGDFCRRRDAEGVCFWKDDAEPTRTMLSETPASGRESGALAPASLKAVDDSADILGSRIDHEHAADEGSDDIRNWRRPRGGQDWAAAAGVAEKRALDALGFSLTLAGKEVGEGNGVHPQTGFIASHVLAKWGVSSYRHLWGSRGKIIVRAKALHLPAADRQWSHAAEALAEAEKMRQEDLRKHAKAGACPAPPGCHCVRCAHTHQLKQVGASRAELERLVRSNRANSLHSPRPKDTASPGAASPLALQLHGAGSAVETGACVSDRVEEEVSALLFS